MYVREFKNFTEATVYGSNTIINLPPGSHNVQSYGYYFSSITLRTILIKIGIEDREYNFTYSGSLQDLNKQLQVLTPHQFESSYVSDHSSFYILSDVSFELCQPGGIFEYHKIHREACRKNIAFKYGYLLTLIETPRISLKSEGLPISKLSWNREVKYINIEVLYPYNILSAKLIINIIYDI